MNSLALFTVSNSFLFIFLRFCVVNTIEVQCDNYVGFSVRMHDKNSDVYKQINLFERAMFRLSIYRTALARVCAFFILFLFIRK